MLLHTEPTSDTNSADAPHAPGEAGGADTCCNAATIGKGSQADIADRRLLAAMTTGSRLALARLHRRYFSRLVKFFQLLPSSAPEVVDDLIAATLFDVWQQCATFASDSSVHVAIMRVAWTHGSAHLANSDAGRSSPQTLSGNRDEQARFSSRPDVSQLPSAVFEALSLSGRAIIHLVYSGHSRQEVADVLGITCEAVDASLTSWRTAHPARLTSSDSIASVDR